MLLFNIFFLSNCISFILLEFIINNFNEKNIENVNLVYSTSFKVDDSALDS